MASVGSLTSSTSNSIRGYGGLASGLDRDELIKGMTIGTTSKLNQQEQKKQKIEWMQEAVRTISDKMISFHGKYTETLTSSSNLFSSMLWGRNKITTTGTNSKYVSVSGTASSADAMTIMGIKQKAQNASWSTVNMASDRVLSADKVVNSGSDKYAALNGKTLEFSYDGKDYSVTIGGDDADLRDPEKAANIIQGCLNNVKIDGSETDKLGNHIKISGDATQGFTISTPDSGDTAKEIKLTGGTAVGIMGIEIDEEGKELTKAASIQSTQPTNLDKDWVNMVRGQTMTFSYNGTSASVKIGDNVQTLEDVRKSLQDSLDAKFGKGRISVEIEPKVEGNTTTGKLTFKTTVPGNGGADDTSILKLTGGSSDAMKALGLSAGSSNRVNLNAKISSFQGFKDEGVVKEEDGKTTAKDSEGNDIHMYSFKLNGKDVKVRSDATINDLMKAIERDANVKVTYQEAADKFTLTSKEDGASGVIDFTAADADGKKNSDEALKTLDSIFNLGFNRAEVTVNGSKEELFKEVKNGTTVYKDAGGNVKYTQDATGKLTDRDNNEVKNATINDKQVTSVRGQDAIVAVKYAGSDEVVELRRGTNAFTVDGLTINVKGEFGYTADANGVKKLDPATEAVEVDASVDVDRLMSTIKSFIEDYNSIVDLVNGELTTKHDSDYDPLTSDQKEELSESEISKWETKAKEGLLYGDSDLRSLSMDLRVVVSGGLLVQFEKVGISLSSNYSDNGKLSIDETKLRAALETNPESVEKLFTSQAGVDADGNETFNGLATNLKNVMNKYVKTTGSMEDKGILIRKAGSKSAAMSLTQNTYYDQLTSIDKLIATLQARLKTEQDRYISQFSTLETMIANMNSQASYLSSM